MAAKKKDKEEEVVTATTKPLFDKELLDKELNEEDSVKGSKKDEVQLESYENLIKSLEVKCNELARELEATQDELVKKQAMPELTEEEKDALNYCFEWIKHFVRNSRNVDFRQKSKDAMATLSKLL